MFRFAAIALVLFAGSARAEDSVAVMKAQLEVKRANVKLAEATLAGAKTSLQRVTQLKATGAASAEEFDKAKQDADIAAAQLGVRVAEARELEVRVSEGEATAKAAVGAKVAVINMSAVMRDFEKAKYQVHLLNARRSELSAPLLKKRDELIALQKDIAAETDPKLREKQVASYGSLQQKYQVEEAEIGKKLDDDVTRIIGALYDDIKVVVDATATANGHALVFGYPDAATAEDVSHPYLKELKLKPPAAIPFFVAKDVDITAAVIKKLNADHPAVDKAGKKVDVSKLAPIASPAPGTKP